MNDTQIEGDNSFKELISRGILIVVTVAMSTYGTTRSYHNTREIKTRMEWFADHNAVYGNKNSKLDLEEKIWS